MITQGNKPFCKIITSLDGLKQTDCCKIYYGIFHVVMIVIDTKMTQQVHG